MQSKCDDYERFKCLRRQAVTPEHAEAVRREQPSELCVLSSERMLEEVVAVPAL